MLVILKAKVKGPFNCILDLSLTLRLHTTYCGVCEVKEAPFSEGLVDCFNSLGTGYDVAPVPLSKDKTCHAIAVSCIYSTNVSCPLKPS